MIKINEPFNYMLTFFTGVLIAILLVGCMLPYLLMTDEEIYKKAEQRGLPKCSECGCIINQTHKE